MLGLITHKRTYRDLILETNPLHYWPLDGGGFHAGDIVSNQGLNRLRINYGTYPPLALVAGDEFAAGVKDNDAPGGVLGSVYWRSQITGLRTLTTLSLACWIQLNALQEHPTRDTIVINSQSDFGNRDTGGFIFAARHWPTDEMIFKYWDDTPVAGIDLQSGQTLTTGKPYLCGVSINSVDLEYEFFLDGESVASGSMPKAMTAHTSNRANYVLGTGGDNLSIYDGYGQHLVCWDRPTDLALHKSLYLAGINGIR